MRYPMRDFPALGSSHDAGRVDRPARTTLALPGFPVAVGVPGLPRHDRADILKAPTPVFNHPLTKAAEDIAIVKA